MQRLAVLFVFAVAGLGAYMIVEGWSVIVIASVVGCSVLLVLPQRLPSMIAAVVFSQTIHIPFLTNSYGLTPFKLFFIGLTFVSVAVIARRGRVVLSAQMFFSAMFVMAFFRGISAFFSSEPSLAAWPELVSSVALVFLCVQFVRSIDDHRDMLRVYVVALLFAGLWVLIEVPPALLATAANVRALGPGNQPNTTASVCAILFFLSLPMIIDKELQLGWRVAAGVGVLANAYIQFATSSRGVILASIFALCVFAWFVQRGAKRRMVAIAALVLTVALFSAAAPSSFVFRMSSTVRAADVGEGIEIKDSMRLELAALALQMIRESPFVGHGVNGFQSRSALMLSGPGVTVHTALLGVAVGMGLPCALLWLTVLVGAFFTSAWLCNKSTGPPQLYYAGLASMLAFKLVFSFSSVELFDQISWLHIGLVYHYLHLHQEAASSAESPLPEQTLQPQQPARVLPLFR